MSESLPINTMFYARWTDDRTKPRPLCSHLSNVSQRAKAFAELARGSDTAFVAAANLAGLLHDLGKYRPAFQECLDLSDPRYWSMRQCDSTPTDLCTFMQ